MKKPKTPVAAELEQIKRTFYRADHARSSIALEPAFWDLLEEQAGEYQASWQTFLTDLHACMPEDCINFSTFVRIYLLKHAVRRLRA